MNGGASSRNGSSERAPFQVGADSVRVLGHGTAQIADESALVVPSIQFLILTQLTGLGEKQLVVT